MSFRVLCWINDNWVVIPSPKSIWLSLTRDKAFWHWSQPVGTLCPVRPGPCRTWNNPIGSTRQKCSTRYIVGNSIGWRASTSIPVASFPLTCPFLMVTICNALVLLCASIDYFNIVKLYFYYFILTHPESHCAGKGRLGVESINKLRKPCFLKELLQW